MNYWLMKYEPYVYSISDLKEEGEAIWDGVRNYQARNFLRQAAVGDLTFFYHSNVKPPGIAGLMRVIEANIADPTQFDTESKYYDPKSTPETPRWQTVKVAFVEEFSELITLPALKEAFQPEELQVVKRGNRLSVMPVTEKIAKKILKIAGINVA